MIARTVDLDEPLHVADFGGAGPALVLVHGLGGSHVNWLAAGPLLAERARVVALDLPGFGRSPLGERSASVGSHMDLVARFVEHEVGGPAVLVGNSMGGLVSLGTAQRHPHLVAGLVLVDPAVPRAPGGGIDPVVAATFATYAVPGVGEAFLRRRVARLGPERMVHETLALCCADPSLVPPEVVQASVELARERNASMPWASGAFLEAARSLMRILSGRRRFDRMITSITTPTLIIQGALDRLVSLDAVRAVARARPDWTLEVYDDVGHVPQLEAPDRFAASVLGWLEGAGKAAAVAAR